MTGLVLKLSPSERVLINKAVIENGERRTKINIITPNAHILRLRDAIHPNEVNTPVRRACYIAQLILTGDALSEQAKPELLHDIEQLSQIFRDSDSRNLISNATTFVIEGETYQALKALRALLSREDRMLSRLL